MVLVVTEKVGPNVTVIRLNRPERLNAMSFELVTALCDVCAEVGADNRCWVVVLIGEGRGFCSGLDLDDTGVIPGIDDMALRRSGRLSRMTVTFGRTFSVTTRAMAALLCSDGSALLLSLPRFREGFDEFSVDEEATPARAGAYCISCRRLRSGTTRRASSVPDWEAGRVPIPAAPSSASAS